MQTNCSALSLAHLTDYGNWCGLGNNALEPVDGMDACCKAHDYCYGNIMQVRPVVADRIPVSAETNRIYVNIY